MNEMSDPHKHIRPCPICRKPAVDHYAPFCSKRCSEIDLGRWLKGAYAIPATETEDEDAEAAEGEPDEGDGALPVRH